MAAAESQKDQHVTCSLSAQLLSQFVGGINRMVLLKQTQWYIPMVLHGGLASDGFIPCEAPKKKLPLSCSGGLIKEQLRSATIASNSHLHSSPFISIELTRGVQEARLADRNETIWFECS